jgi:hypothetical protein
VAARQDSGNRFATRRAATQTRHSPFVSFESNPHPDRFAMFAKNILHKKIISLPEIAPFPPLAQK